jgi:tetratricopeptide (TPR) repeat protein
VLELDGRNVKALYRRAQAYINLADLDLAEIDIKKALEIDPDNRYFTYMFLQLFRLLLLSVLNGALIQLFPCELHSNIYNKRAKANVICRVGQGS